MKEEKLFVDYNGKLLPISEGRISFQDRGLLLGDGLFETIRSCDGKLFFFQKHWERLKRGAKVLEIFLNSSLEQLQKKVETLLEVNQLKDKEAVVRITLTRGVGGRGLDYLEEISSTMLIGAQSYAPKAPEEYKAKQASIRRNEYSPLAQLKSLNYLDNILAFKEAKKAGKDEAIMLNTKEKIAGTSRGNIFFVVKGTLCTPPLSDGALPGVIRGDLLEKAATWGISIEERSFSFDDLKNTEEIFMTNSLKGVVPITAVDDFEIGKGKAGENARFLQTYYISHT